MELLTVGHGTSSADEFATLVTAAGIEVVADVRRFPGSRRHPHFGRAAMGCWLSERGVAYQWHEQLGGRRRGSAQSPNVGLRNAAFRAYADYMRTPEFATGMQHLLEIAKRRSAIMCAESLWWRCHRRLIADVATLLHGVEVRHVMPDGKQQPHAPTPGAIVHDAGLVYPSPQPPVL